MELKINKVCYLEERNKSKWYNCFSDKSNNIQKEILLNNVNIDIKPGTVTAFLGAGLGHVKLLECIALRQTEGFMAGHIEYDSSSRKSGAFKDIVFVTDTGSSHFDSLTVFDYLFYAARLRISHGNIECRERARVATKLVGLDGTCLIGKLSKGERSLLTIAAELVGYPTLVCLLNPFEGLDASSTLHVMYALYRVAKRVSTPTTVVYTVQGLNNDMLRYVNNVAVFVGPKLELLVSLRDLQESVLPGVKNLITDMSAQIVQFPNLESDITSDAAINLNDLVRKFCLDIDELICAAAATTKVSIASKVSTGKSNSSSKFPKGKTKSDFLRKHSLDPYRIDDDMYDEDFEDGDYFDREDEGLQRVESEGFGWSSIVQGHRASQNSTQSLRARSSRPAGTGGQFLSTSRRLGELGQPARQYKPLWKEFVILFSRAWKYHFKNRTQIRMSSFRFLAAGLVVGGMAYRDGLSSNIGSVDLLYDPSNGLINPSAYNVTSVLFIITVISVMGTAFAIPYMHASARILKMEVAAGLHTTISSWLVLLTVDMPMFLVAGVGVAALVWLLVGVQGSSSAFFGTVILGALSGYTLASACAILCATVDRAYFWFALWGAAWIIFTGFLQPIPSLPVFWPWATTAAFTRWSFESLMITAFGGASYGNQYLSKYGFNSGSTQFCITWLLVWFGSLQGLVIVGLLPPIYKMKLIDRDRDHVKVLDLDDPLLIVPPTPARPPQQEEPTGGPLRPPATPAATATGQSSGGGTSGGGSRDGASGGVSDGFRNGAIDVGGTRGNAVGVKGCSPYDDDDVSASFGVTGGVLDRDSPSPGPGGDIFRGSAVRSIADLKKSIIMDDKAIEANTIRNKFAGFTVKDPSECFTVVPLRASAQITLTFQRLKYVENAGQGIADPMIQGFSGSVDPGSSLCIVDGNNVGSGQLLLEILAGRARATGKVSGSIKANGAKLKRGLMYINAAYVARGDVAISPMTVREVVRYAALLRRTDQRSCPNMMMCLRKTLGVGSDYSTLSPTEFIGRSGDVDERVEEALKMLGLIDVADVRIGDFHYSKCNITPAQLRCLTIAVEMVNRPGLLFFEDPVGGLDWADADIVAAGIQCLVEGGRTAVCHLPDASHRVYETFSDVVLIGSGLMLYHGPTHKAAPYFDNIGFEHKSDQNPLQFIVAIASELGVMKAQSGRRVTALSPEDLADLCRSLLNIQGNSSPGSGGGSSGRALKGGRKGSRDRGMQDGEDTEEDEDFDQSVRGSGATSGGAGGGDGGGDGASAEEGRAGSGSGKKGSGKGNGKSSFESSYVIGAKSFGPPVGPTTRLLMVRGMQQLLADKVSLVYFFLRYISAGFVVGTVWLGMGDGDYQQRVNLLAMVYVCVNSAIVDQIPGIHRRMETFVRERASGASCSLAYWIADSAPLQVLNFIGSVLFIIPVYYMAGLRKGTVHFLYFYVMVLISNYCNLGLAYVVCLPCRSEHTSRMVFNGVLIPLQMLMSGFLILISTMKIWYKWGTLICPMMYFLSGTFDNEFNGNSNALGTTETTVTTYYYQTMANVTTTETVTNSFSNLSDLYGFSVGQWRAAVVLAIIGAAYRLLWLLMLKVSELYERRDVRLRAGAAHHKAKMIVSAGLRWSYHSTPSTDREQDSMVELESNSVLHGAASGGYTHAPSAPQPIAATPSAARKALAASFGLFSGGGSASATPSSNASGPDGTPAFQRTPTDSSFDSYQVQSSVSPPAGQSPFLSRGALPPVWSKPYRPQPVAQADEDDEMSSASSIEADMSLSL